MRSAERRGVCVRRPKDKGSAVAGFSSRLPSHPQKKNDLVWILIWRLFSVASTKGAQGGGGKPVVHERQRSCTIEQTDRQTGRQAGRQTERLRQRQRQRQGRRQRDGDRDGDRESRGAPTPAAYGIPRGSRPSRRAFLAAGGGGVWRGGRAVRPRHRGPRTSAKGRREAERERDRDRKRERGREIERERVRAQKAAERRPASGGLAATSTSPLPLPRAAPSLTALLSVLRSVPGRAAPALGQTARACVRVQPAIRTRCSSRWPRATGRWTPSPRRW